MCIRRLYHFFRSFLASLLSFSNFVFGFIPCVRGEGYYEVRVCPAPCSCRSIYARVDCRMRIPLPFFLLSFFFFLAGTAGRWGAREPISFAFVLHLHGSYLLSFFLSFGENGRISFLGFRIFFGGGGRNLLVGGRVGRAGARLAMRWPYPFTAARRPGPVPRTLGWAGLGFEGLSLGFLPPRTGGGATRRKEGKSEERGPRALYLRCGSMVPASAYRRSRPVSPLSFACILLRLSFGRVLWDSVFLPSCRFHFLTFALTKPFF